MLQSLTIENYALIDQLEIRFNSGFSIITGETGAGKSVLIGALSLILGQRADNMMLKDKSKKCIVEGVFNIGNYKLRDFFITHELDFDNTSIMRREILPEGKSRAFINDTPVSVSLLKELGTKLVDIHSQHENLLLSDHQFQLKVVDTIAGHSALILQYRKEFLNHRDLVQKSVVLSESSQKAKDDLDYFQFQFNQLMVANLSDVNEQQLLESDYQTLTHAEEIRLSLSQTDDVLNNNESSVISQIRNVSNMLSSLKSFFPKADDFLQRFETILIELKDIAAEAGNLSQSFEYKPEDINRIAERLNLIYTLQQKHHASSVAQLIDIRNTLEQEINTIASFDTELANLTAMIDESLSRLTDLSVKITGNRKKTIPVIEKKVSALLIQMGMPHADFAISIEPTTGLLINGADRMNFLFSANRNIEKQEISKVASGGEFSRLMLSIKSLLSQESDMPTIIFDEIDTGVSGEIADKVGNILLGMSGNVQLINITHSPQIAVKGKTHYFVYKTEDHKTTSTHIRQLTYEEQVIEIAKMLSGNELTDAAILNAKELLKN